jgi:hypothetical protein
VLVLLVVASFLAGCIGGEDPLEKDATGVSGPEEQAAPTETLGSVSGQIVRSDGLEPIAGAEVYLTKDGSAKETATNAQGRFVFNGLEPGVYRMQVIATCCKPYQENVGVKAGEVTDVPVQLTVVRTLRAYMDPNGLWEGFIGCGVMYPTAFQPITCPDPNNDVTRVFEADVGLQTIVIGMEWDNITTNVNGALRIALYRGQPGNLGQGHLALIDRQGPIEFRLDANAEDEKLDWDAAEEPMEFTIRVWAGKDTPSWSNDLNVVYQQSFTVYWHLFYGEPAPEGHSAIPDA